MLSRFFKRESAKADFGSGLPGAPLDSIYGPEGRPAEPSLEPSSTLENDGSVTSSVAAEIGSRCASVPNMWGSPIEALPAPGSAKTLTSRPSPFVSDGDARLPEAASGGGSLSTSIPRLGSDAIPPPSSGCAPQAPPGVAIPRAQCPATARPAAAPRSNQPDGQDHICVVRWESLKNPMLSEPRLSWTGITKELKDHARLAKPGIDMPAHGPVSEMPTPRTRTRVVMHRPL